MTLQEKNLAALSQRFPALVPRLRGLSEVPDRGIWTQARSGVPTVSRDGVSLASGFDPGVEASRVAVPAEDCDFVLLPGLGAGYLAEALARRKQVPVLVAEADPGWFLEVLRHRDLTELWSSPWVVPLLGPDPGVVGNFLSDHACRTVQTISWRPLVEQEPTWHQALADQVAQAQARSRVNLATAHRFGPMWQRNLRKNEAWAESVRPLEALKGLWSGIPVVIAAAGPSLVDSLEWIRAHRSQAALIAVDTAWPALAAHRLNPDLLLVLDGQYANGRHVDRPPSGSTLVVTEWIGPPRAFRLAPGRTYVAASSLPFLRRREQSRWGTLGALPSGGSVATAAWSLALHLGCAKVVFAGLDLAYPQGQTHVPGSQFEEALHRNSSRLSPAETLGRRLRPNDPTWRPSTHGPLVMSDPRMDLFREWLAQAVGRCPDVEAFNLSTRGSLIPGLKPAPAGLGDQWPPSQIPNPGQTPCLVPQSDSELPSFDLLQQTLGAEDFGTAVAAAWASAESYWGPEVWTPWTRRAFATWSRFPSSRSRRALEEVIGETLNWKGFWTILEQSEKKS